MKTFNHNGRDYHYDDNSRFIFELGRYTNSYKQLDEWPCPDAALQRYQEFHVSDGYKKRLVLKLNNNEKIVLAKEVSKRSD
jgi:hypothetical protein